MWWGVVSLNAVFQLKTTSYKNNSERQPPEMHSSNQQVSSGQAGSLFASLNETLSECLYKTLTNIESLNQIVRVNLNFTFGIKKKKKVV